MKFVSSRFKIIFTFILMAFSVNMIISSSLTKNKFNSRKNNLNTLERTTVLVRTFNSTNETNQNESVPTNGTNVIGSNGDKSRIEGGPFKITSCDQILAFEADTLDDVKDFKIKSKRYFTVSMYAVVQFKEKDPSKFESFINVNALQFVPDIIRGSVSCIKFKSIDSNIYICLKNKNEANSFLDAWKNFTKCRAGNNLSKPIEKPIDKLKGVLSKTCYGLDVSFDEKAFKNPIELEGALNLAITNTMKAMADNYDNFMIQPDPKEVAKAKENLLKKQKENSTK